MRQQIEFITSEERELEQQSIKDYERRTGMDSSRRTGGDSSRNGDGSRKLADDRRNNLARERSKRSGYGGRRSAYRDTSGELNFVIF